MKQFHSSASSNISINKTKTVLTKTCKRKMYGSLKEDLDTYNKLFGDDKNFVKILSVENANTFTMEYVPDSIGTLYSVLSRHDTAKKICTKAFLLEAIDIVNRSFLLPLQESKQFSESFSSFKWFMNRDCKLANFIVTKDYKIMAIDPDSYNWNFCAGGHLTYAKAQMDLMFYMERYFG